MKTYVLSHIFSDSYLKLLQETFKDLVIISKVVPLNSIEALKSSEDKILVIEPEFVEWELSEKDLALIPNLKAVLVCSTSFGWACPEYLAANKIPLINIKDWCTQSVAEYAVMLAFNLARRIPLIIKSNYALDYAKFAGTQLKGKTVGIIGMGHIGFALAERFSGLGMNVVYWSRNSKREIGKYVSMSDLFKTADFVFPTMADNKETQSLITDAMLQSMKFSAFFVSLVHKYYNHDLLLKMVKEGKLSGYGFEDESVQMSDFDGNVWVVPPYAWCTKEASETSDAKLIENIKCVLKGDFGGRVN